MMRIGLARSGYLLLASMFAGAAFAPNPAQAQESRADSLEARVRRLEALVDSLLRVLPAAEPAPEAAEPRDALAALREAAQAAAEEVAPASTDSGAEQSRTSSLTALNPEISVTGDLVGGFLSPGVGDNASSVVPREFELAFQSALDPYTRTKIFFSKEEEVPIAGLEEVLAANAGVGEEEEETGGNAIELEEAYVTWVGLPGSIGLKLGKFREEIGLFNRWHTHALMEVERPLATAAFLGDDGLIQTGASVVLPSVRTGSGTQTLTLEATRADNKLFAGGSDLSYLGRLQSFWDLSPSAWVQFGINGVTGHNDEIDLDTDLLSVDVSFRWSPPARARFQELTLRGEWYWADRNVGLESFTGNGGYAQGSYRWNQQWITGFRADWLDPFADAPNVVQLVPSITWWQSEWVRLRLQYNFLKRAGFAADHTLLFQTVWSIGPHRHETY